MRNWLTSNTSLKLIALFLAVFIWFFVRAVTSDTRMVEGVPVEVKAPPGYTVLQVTPKSVNVVVRGTTEDLRQASRYELFAVVEAPRGDGPGRQAVAIFPRDIRHPRRVQVMAVEPTNILVRVEKSPE